MIGTTSHGIPVVTLDMQHPASAGMCQHLNGPIRLRLCKPSEGSNASSARRTHFILDVSQKPGVDLISINFFDFFFLI